ncbi:Serine/threonine-protein kinase ppk4 [Paramyrothecium foliicola]|nr:Serine/threonine-protein kinase ppk4 [Paramyrothecium foliicola]
MPQRPPGEGRRSAPQNKLLLAFAFILIPWLQLADAQQQQRQPSAALPSHGQHDLKHRHGDPDQPIVPRWADDVDDSRETIVSGHREHDPIAYEKGPQQVVNEQVIWGSDPSARKPQRQQKRDRQLYDPISNNNNKKPAPFDASALATFALAPKSVRASDPSRHLGSASSSAGGLASPQLARSLRDWEVEDFVLLATVDGDLYATDRKTGQQRWHLEVDQPMIETHHYRANSSVLDEDFNPVDHYIWAVEPTTNGGLYLWNPSATSPVRTGFTMKRLVEELAPYANNDLPVIYTGDKKTTLITLDAATGRVLKWFGSGGSHINEDARESCLQSNALYDSRNEECSTSSAGTITLGRTEYTVEIHRSDGRRVATLKYSEWGPNHFDNDLYDQYHESIDDRYITSEHNGKVYAFDYFRSGKVRPVFTHQLAGPVARVFDVCRPGDAPSDSNPGLVVLPQPPMPSQDADDENMRGNSIFLNHTESGDWYALSGNAYPLIIKAPIAQISRPDWGLLKPHWDTINESKLSKALVGTHILGAGYTHKQQQSLPPGTKPNVYQELPEHESNAGSLAPAAEETPTIITTFKALPKSAADSVKDFISNPILIILFVGALFYHEKKIRRGYHHFRHTGSIKETMLYFTSDSTESFRHDSSALSTENEVAKPEPKSAVADDAATAEKATEPQVTNQDDLVKPEPGAEPQVAPDAAEPKATEEVKPTLDDQKSESQASGTQKAHSGDSAGSTAEPAPEKKKKAHRGRRGGVKHRKGRAREASQSREDDPTPTTVDEAVNNAKKLGDRPSLEPDVMTVANDVQAVSGPIIRLGNIEVNMDDQLGTGSNGTLVFAGKYDDREVAVKRMLIQFYDIASQETKLLRESDDHPNVIRYYAQQQRDGFLYIALERCAASLADVVEKPHVFRELAIAGKLDLPGVLYQITNGISHLHELRIVHRDLKPQNILVNMGKDGKPRLLVSDFGLCKKLEGGQSSFGATTGRAAGTSGWRAPELLLDDDARDAGVVDISTHSGSGSVLVNDHLSPNARRATRAIDIFSLGLVFFYVLTNGSHPFDCGDRYMREVNIRKNNYNLRPLDALGDFAYEAEDLIESMLQADAKMRPNAKDVMSHPFFWSAKKRLAFLCDVSDHFEKEPRDPPSPALTELERHAASVTKGDFLRQLPREFVDSLGKQRKYTGSKLLDLLRALRNKRNHYEDMPDSLKRTVGPLPDGYLAFWTVRFPMLLLVCWNVVYNVQWEETDRFREYYIPAGL